MRKKIKLKFRLSYNLERVRNNDNCFRLLTKAFNICIVTKKSTVMKTLKTIGLLLMLATGVLAQPNPNDMFIDGYVLDVSGQAVANHEVCVQYVSNNPSLPSDSVCTTTNANGYYFINIANGSLTGPNVSYNVSTYDPCALLPLVQTRENYQGSIDTANVNFAICATSTGCNNLQAWIAASVDSSNGIVYTFTANASGGTPAYTFQWLGVVGNQTGSVVTYQANPNEIFDVCLVVADANGCAFTTCDTVYVGNVGCDIEVEIISSIDTINGNQTVLTAVPTNGIAPYAYVWDVTGVTTAVLYENQTQPGPQCVTVWDNTGCSATACDSIANSNQGCSVDITTTVDSTGGGLVYTLTASGGFVDYQWSTGALTQSITVSNPSPNGDVICVTATEANGCSATACDTLLPISNGNCFADFWYQSSNPNSPISAGDTVTFSYSGSVAQYNYYYWTVQPQGEFSFEQSPEFVFPASGSYEVCLTVTDSITNCSDTYCETINVLSGNSGGCGGTITTSIDTTLLGVMYTFTANPTGTAPFMYTWVNGDNAQSTMIEASQLGGVPICVVITDATGCTVTVCDTLNPNTGSCSAQFSWVESNILGSPLPAVEFTDQSQGAVYWFWDFGDNTSSTDQNPLHTYSSTGTYFVCLTIVNADQSCQQTYCDTIVVGNPSGACNAGFSNSGPTPIGYTFSANVQNPNINYYWEIDGVPSGTGYEAFAPGLSNGVHIICLSVIDSLNNCSDTECLTITVGSNNCYGYISGQLYAGSNNQPLDEGVVYLITYDVNTNQLTAVDSMVVDSDNYYFFGPLACGDYLVKAAAYPGSQYYSNHIPTYYGTSPFWGFAQTVTLGQINTQVTADIFLIAANNPGGPGFIGGDVSQGANKMDPGDPLADMQVMLFDMSGNAIAYTYTDANGEFGFSNLAYGSYQVYVEQLGVQTIPAYVTIGPNEPSVEDVHILASETLITTGIVEFDFDGAISEVYPNPVGENATISFNLETEVMVNINILDLAGRTVSTATRSVSSGENQVRFGVDGLTDGYYFLNIQDVDGAFSVTRKFMRVD